jgi:hypothetical protein
LHCITTCFLHSSALARVISIKQQPSKNTGEA